MGVFITVHVFPVPPPPSVGKNLNPCEQKILLPKFGKENIKPLWTAKIFTEGGDWKHMYGKENIKNFRASREKKGGHLEQTHLIF